MKNFFVSTFVTGILLLVPVFFLAFTLTRTFAAFRDIVAPLVETLASTGSRDSCC